MRRHFVLAGLFALGVLSSTHPSAIAQQQPAVDQSSPVKVAEAIVTACRAGDIDAVEGFMHPVMRYRWTELGLDPRQMCDGITKGGRLRSAKAEVEPSLRESDYVPVLLVYTYDDGTEISDRMVFFREKGVWKLIA